MVAQTDKSSNSIAERHQDIKKTLFQTKRQKYYPQPSKRRANCAQGLPSWPFRAPNMLQNVPPGPPDNPLHQLFMSATKVQWYLVALIWWRVLGSLIETFHPFARMLTAYMVAAMVAYVSTDFLSLPRIGYFPAFVAGQLFPYDKALSKLQWRPITAMIGMLMLVAIGSLRSFVPAYGLVLVDNFPTSHFMNNVASPADMPLFWLRFLASTSLELLKSIVFLFVVCPRSNTCFTDAGKYSLYPYLLHLCVLPWLGKAAVLTPWLKDRTDISSPLKVIVVVIDILICSGVCAMLASRPVRFVFMFLEPTWLRNFYIKDVGKDKQQECNNTDQERSK